MTDGPLEDRDCQKNPVIRKEATAEFLKRRDEQISQLKISDTSEESLKSAISHDDLFQLSVKLIKDVKKLRGYIKREEKFETNLANMTFDEIFCGLSLIVVVR